MMLQPDGHLTSCDLLHTVAGAVIFDFYENRDARLVALKIPDDGAPHLPRPGLRPARRPQARPDSPPTSPRSAPSSSRRPGSPPTTSNGSSPRSPGSPLLMFIKEDEDLYPNLDYSPVAERTRRAVAGDRAGQEASAAASA